MKKRTTQRPGCALTNPAKNNRLTPRAPVWPGLQLTVSLRVRCTTQAVYVARLGLETVNRDCQ